jgi:hypothetical protein
MASARAREREGQAAFDREDLARARQAFQAAESDYQAAAQESGRAAEAAGADLVSQARQAASEQRRVAQSAGADMLAREIFDGGAGRVREAEALARDRKWSQAADAYRDAAERYAAAGQRVRDIADVRPHADTARERREAATRAGAERLARELFDAAAARHTEADRLARGSDVRAAIPIYDEVAAQYREAERRATALARPPLPPAVPDQARQEVLDVLANYSRAFEAKDAGLLQKLRPGLSPRELDSYREIWRVAATFRVVLNPERVSIRGNEAEVTGRREDVVILPDGRRERGGGERPFRFRLRRGKDGWAIEAVE